MTSFRLFAQLVAVLSRLKTLLSDVFKLLSTWFKQRSTMLSRKQLLSSRISSESIQTSTSQSSLNSAKISIRWTNQRPEQLWLVNFRIYDVIVLQNNVIFRFGSLASMPSVSTMLTSCSKVSWTVSMTSRLKFNSNFWRPLWNCSWRSQMTVNNLFKR